MSLIDAQSPILSLGMFILRTVSGFALIYYQGWVQMMTGWTWLWSEDGKQWDLVDQFGQSLPGPLASTLAFFTAIFFFVCPALLFLGFLTRVNAFFIFTGLILTLLYGIELSSTLAHQTMLIYLVVMIFFVLNGGGALALDRLFQRRRGLDTSSSGLYSGR